MNRQTSPENDSPDERSTAKPSGAHRHGDVGSSPSGAGRLEVSGVMSVALRADTPDDQQCDHRMGAIDQGGEA